MGSPPLRNYNIKSLWTGRCFQAMFKSASRVGLTPSPTCRPGKVDPERGCGHSATKRSHENVALLGKPMEGFLLGVAHHTRSGNLFPTCRPLQTAGTG